jgi:mannose-1-phosphate guanylyltransferase
MLELFSSDKQNSKDIYQANTASTNLSKVVVLITAGGKGTRLWPLSTNSRPKQFCSLIAEQTMLQLMFTRVIALLPVEKIFVISTSEQASLIKQQLPDLEEENIIIEPEARDTASAIGYAAVYIENKIPDATMVVLASDQYIEQVDKFQESILKSIKIAQSGSYLVSVGIVPTEPNTEYGYMKCGKEIEFGSAIYSGISYVEKPDFDTANFFVKSGSYLWNTNIFVWKVKNLLDAFKFYQPNTYATLKKIQYQLNTISFQELHLIYKNLEKISIDYALMEQIKSGDVFQHAFVAGTFGWSDIGNFLTLAKFLESDLDGNRFKGFVKQEASKDCIFICELPYELYVEEVLRLIVVINKLGDILITSADSVKNIKHFFQSSVCNNLNEDGDIQGDIPNRKTKLLNTKNLIFDTDNNNTIYAFEVQNLIVQIRDYRICIYNNTTCK